MNAAQHSYDSIAAAAAGLSQAGTRCTKADLRKWKKEGAAGFRGSRVYPAELIPWLKARESQGITGITSGEPVDKEGLEAKRLRLQCEGLDLANAEKRGLLWDAGAVKASWLTHLRNARQVLLSMATDLAPRIAGRPAIEVEKMLRGAVGKALEKLRGNPYGDGAKEPPRCGECGHVMELILAEQPPIAEGKEAKKKKAK